MVQTLAELLAGARTAAGLSQAALARAMGVSRITIHQAELGRDPRCSTLARYRRTLPGLLPAELLGGGEDRVPPSLDAAWLLQREIFGAFARSLERRVTIGPDRAVERVLRATGLRSLRGRLRDPEVRTDVVRMALRGSSAALPGRYAASPQDLEGRTVVIPEGDFVHELTFPRSLERAGLACLRRQAAGEVAASTLQSTATDATDCLSLGSCVAIEHPVEELRLALDLPPGFVTARAPLLLAWAAPFVPERGERDLADRLHPGGRGVTLNRAGGSLVATVRRPLVGTCYALGWRPVPGRPAAASRQMQETGDTLRIAREQAMLSRRGLAERMRVSPTTISQVEHGRDVRRSTLQSYLEALPDLSPWDLLGDDEGMALSATDAWMYLRDLFGCEVEEDSKVVRLNAAGDATIQIQTTSLVRRRDAPGDFHLRIGYSPTVMRRSKARLREVRASTAAAQPPVRIAPISGVDGERLHQLIVPRALARAGVTYTRRLTHPGVYVVTAARARERTGDPGPFHEGASFAATLPTRRLRLAVHFSAGCWPEDPRVHAWPLTQVPDPRAPDLAARLHPKGLSLEASRSRRTLAVTVERPLIHVKYALSWQLA